MYIYVNTNARQKDLRHYILDRTDIRHDIYMSVCVYKKNPERETRKIGPLDVCTIVLYM